MNISALSELSAASTAAATKATKVDPNTTFLQPGDASALERIYGQTTLAGLESDPNGQGFLQEINILRGNGVTGSIASFVPAAELTSSDAALLESITGTKTIAAAVSSQNGDELMDNIAAGRELGYLSGNVTTAFLKNILTAANVSEVAGGWTGLPSSSFLEQAIAYVQNEAAASTLDTNA